MSFTVGFDLDMTLIDSRPGVARAIDILGAEFGIDLHGARFATRLGPPLAQMLAEAGAPTDLIPAMVTRYRGMYPSVVPEILPMAGAGEALAAVRALGGQILVVTGKHQPHAELHVAALRWQVDTVIGDLWSAGKAEALSAHAATVFVGDHTGDMIGARAAEVRAVGVTTGPCTAEQLWRAGAHVVLADLTEFPEWLTAEYSRASR